MKKVYIAVAVVAFMLSLGAITAFAQDAGDLITDPTSDKRVESMTVADGGDLITDPSTKGEPVVVAEGSDFVADPSTTKPVVMADGGDLITDPSTKGKPITV